VIEACLCLFVYIGTIAIIHPMFAYVVWFMTYERTTTIKVLKTIKSFLTPW